MKSPFSRCLLLCLSMSFWAAPMMAAPTAPAKKPTKAGSKVAPKKAPTKTLPPKPTVKPAVRPPAPPPAPPLPLPFNPPALPVVPVEPPAPVAVPVAQGPQTWALLVGVSQYQNPQISGLKYPAKDAAGLRDTLLDPRLGGLASDQVLLLADEGATRGTIEGAVDTFLRPRVKSGDKVIVFLAGHGIAKGVGLEARSYLLPNDARGLTTAALDASAVNLRTFTEKLGSLPAKQFLLFVDACREDPTPGRGIKGNTMTDVLSRGVQVVPEAPGAESATFFACSVGERAYEDSSYGHGVFTNWILDGIKQAAVPTKPDGAVDMGRLSSYVSQRVTQWAKTASAAGDFELQQTPELVSHGVTGPLVLMRVKRPFAETPLPASPPRLLVAASPEGAVVTINGQRAGTGLVGKEVAAEGRYEITVSAPGYAPLARSVQAMGGYEQQVVVQLQPVAGGAGATGAPDPAAGLFARATEAAARQQWEIAEQGYQAALGANPAFLPAHEALLELHRAQGRNLDAIGDALALLARAPRGAAPLATLSRTYSRYAEKGAGPENALSSVSPVSGFGTPANAADAANLAVRAATQAVALEPNAAAANLAHGYALLALDTKGKNKRAALTALGKAAFLDGQDSANHLGLGYALRFYALQQKKEDDKRSDLNRAVSALQEAVRLRPSSYEALRELGYSYTLLGETDKALHAFQQANAHRGAASDANEVAGNELALASLHNKKATEGNAQQRAAHGAASQGYMAEAKETAPDLKIAMRLLNQVGVSTSLATYLPAELRPLLDIKGSIESEIRRKLPSIPGIRLPRF